MDERAELIARIERAESDFRRYVVRQGATDFFSVDLTMQQLRALFVLAASASLSAHELAETLGIGPTTLTGIVDRLQARGLVHRLPDGQDRRVRRIVLTDAGRDLLRDLHEVKREHQRWLLGRLELDVLGGLARAVEAMARICAEEAGPWADPGPNSRPDAEPHSGRDVADSAEPTVLKGGSGGIRLNP